MGETGTIMDCFPKLLSYREKGEERGEKEEREDRAKTEMLQLQRWPELIIFFSPRYCVCCCHTSGCQKSICLFTMYQCLAVTQGISLLDSEGTACLAPCTLYTLLHSTALYSTDMYCIAINFSEVYCTFAML